MPKSIWLSAFPANVKTRRRSCLSWWRVAMRRNGTLGATRGTNKTNRTIIAKAAIGLQPSIRRNSPAPNPKTRSSRREYYWESIKIFSGNRIGRGLDNRRCRMESASAAWSDLGEGEPVKGRQVFKPTAHERLPARGSMMIHSRLFAPIGTRQMLADHRGSPIIERGEEWRATE